MPPATAAAVLWLPSLPAFLLPVMRVLPFPAILIPAVLLLAMRTRISFLLFTITQCQWTCQPEAPVRFSKPEDAELACEPAFRVHCMNRLRLPVTAGGVALCLGTFGVVQIWDQGHAVNTRRAVDSFQPPFPLCIPETCMLIGNAFVSVIHLALDVLGRPKDGTCCLVEVHSASCVV